MSALRRVTTPCSGGVSSGRSKAIRMTGTIPAFGRSGRNGDGAQIGQESLVTRAVSIAVSIAVTEKSERLVMTVLA
jgi:hypothetical protein